MAKDGPGGWRIDPYGVERWWDGTKWHNARDPKHDVVARASGSATAPSSPIMPAASFTRPPATKAPSPYARPTAPAFYFPATPPPLAVAVGKRLGVPLSDVQTSLRTVPLDSTPSHADWQRASREWKKGLEERRRAIEQLEHELTGCIGCGCLSMKACWLLNPEDALGDEGAGARRLDLPPGPSTVEA